MPSFTIALTLIVIGIASVQGIAQEKWPVSLERAFLIRAAFSDEQPEIESVNNLLLLVGNRIYRCIAIQ